MDKNWTENTWILEIPEDKSSRGLVIGIRRFLRLSGRTDVEARIDINDKVVLMKKK